MTDAQKELIAMALFAISDPDASKRDELIRHIKSMDDMGIEQKFKYLDNINLDEFTARKILADAISRSGYFY